MDKAEVNLLKLETGRLWPHHKGKKALSANTLTKILREIEYKEIPLYILLAAAKRGEKFHEIIQKFFQTGNHPAFVDLVENSGLDQVERRIHETVNFSKKNETLKSANFLGKEKLHYTFYEGELLATYVDLEFHDCIVELKSNRIKVKELNFDQDKVCLDKFDKLFNTPFALLIFEIQLLIQHLCTGKNVYLLWSTGEGIIFNKFQISQHSLKILDMLIDLVQNENAYSPQIKKTIVQEMINKYYPNQKLIK